MADDHEAPAADPHDSDPDEQEGVAAPPGQTGLAWRLTERLNRFARRFMGPAQVGERAGATVVPDQLPSSPCAVCGKPLVQHDLVRTSDAKMRLYCPTD